MPSGVGTYSTTINHVGFIDHSSHQTEVPVCVVGCSLDFIIGSILIGADTMVEWVFVSFLFGESATKQKLSPSRRFIKSTSQAGGLAGLIGGFTRAPVW